uniref:Uncharacterized protein n=1 Tax=Ciona intestinalis TaxID=7719 RepID=H2XUH6_CIOIN
MCLPTGKRFIRQQKSVYTSLPAYYFDYVTLVLIRHIIYVNIRCSS